MSFEGKVALVTGSSRGIGRAIAVELARRGADVVVNYLRKASGAEETVAAIEALGRRALAVRADLREIDQIDAMFEETQRVFGGLDILVNNAASGYNRPAMEQRVKGWDWTMNINARAVLFASQNAARLMEPRGGGKIVNISSLGSFRVFLPEYIAVGASKAAMEALTRYLAVELGPMNIAVNCVSGGIVETDALKFFPVGQELLEAAAERTPAGRLVTPEDIAYAVAFLCSEEAYMIRGQTIIVDGGLSLPFYFQSSP
ncbi:MAG: enoyl-[acyl-carrier-protein] reductase FabL [Chloroflexi bacterium]|nr:MAG: enoyl-[acyl-carrier-protein] reductase FabL [Chloroflexota bacterium]